MILLAGSAALIGFVHALAPGHWLPVVLLAKARKWNLQTTLLGALVTATGHVMVSLGLGIVSLVIGSQLFHGREEEFERYGAILLIVFGLLYAAQAYFRHSSCHGHSHHGPEPGKTQKGPFAFLFGIGFSPCVAVLPVFAAAATHGGAATMATMIAFAVGVVLSFFSSTTLASRGLSYFDHPIFEHYGDVLTGIGIFLMGVVLFFFPI